MNIVGRFNKSFGIQSNLDKERKQFVNRINQAVFEYIDSEKCRTLRYAEVFDILCFQLGENANDLHRKHGRKDDFGVPDLPPTIRTLTQDDFTKTLLVLCLLYGIYKSREEYYMKDVSRLIDGTISTAMDYATCDLGIRWKDGLFYPSGAEELDKPLIEEPLVWLSKYPKERKDYEQALKCYEEGTHLGDVVSNCYLSLEGITRIILGNDKTLDNNKDALLAHIGLSEGWKAILGTYIKYAHDFRHASKDRDKVSKEEAEAFLYMTGLIMRLLIAKQ